MTEASRFVRGVRVRVGVRLQTISVSGDGAMLPTGSRRLELASTRGQWWCARIPRGPVRRRRPAARRRGGPRFGPEETALFSAFAQTTRRQEHQEARDVEVQPQSEDVVGRIDAE